ncbi:hypothetical protein GJ631_14990 [Natronomonas sp. CBA1123]|uniref:DUF7692 domain-containing protein n=1 Tax=Natronomonas sp. CBA1123 TaxID=2668070 RepID=UPI0012EA2E4A|nr:hypothetical protein [Natronomonas sp. CBA1123]MUV87821.1 hypothetical protein [Natronomonas sp. CBA1123]
MGTDIPKQVRIRTDPEADLGHRYESIEQAADFYGVSKTKAVVFACHDIRQLVDGVETVLSRDDLTPNQKAEIAEIFAARGVEVTVDETVSMGFNE